jgi:hypothetical protein
LGSLNHATESGSQSRRDACGNDRNCPVSRELREAAERDLATASAAGSDRPPSDPLANGSFAPPDVALATTFGGLVAATDRATYSSEEEQQRAGDTRIAA